MSHSCEICGKSGKVLNLECLKNFQTPERLDGLVDVCEECADLTECECGESVPNEEWEDHSCYWTEGEAFFAAQSDDR